MKYLSNYMQDAQTQLFANVGAFFAFSNQQFDEKKVEGVEYSQLGSGMIVPKGKEQEVMDSLDSIYKTSIAQDIAENGKEGVIRRELFNHECFYDGGISRCIEALSDYGFTREEIIKAYNHIRATQEVD